MFGRWYDASAAGFHNRMGNPRYMFQVGEDGADSDGLVPLVVQIIQFVEHRQKDKESIRVDLFAVRIGLIFRKPRLVRFRNIIHF